MKRGSLMAASLFAISIGSASTSVVAAPCAGFTDVDTAHIFCNSVQWLKNRAITLGCTSPTLYCPGDVVTRASMALFMNRLGIAITPKLIGLQNATSAQNLTPGPFWPFCWIAPPLPSVAYPQTVRARGSVSLSATGPNLEMFLMASLNSGGFINLNSTGLVIANPNGLQNLSWSSNAVAVAPGTSVSFAIGIANPAGSVGSLSLAPGTCAIEADIVNANPTSPPFDE